MTLNTDNKKRKALMDTGRKLFWKYGFRRVTLDEICREAQVSKMTFYRWFTNKTELARAIYENEIRHGMERFNAIMEADIPAAERLKAIIKLKAEGTNDISREFLMDFYNSDDDNIKSFVEELTARSWNEIISGFRTAQEKGWFRKDFKPELLLFITQHLVPMYTDEKLLKLYDSPQDLILELANFFTYGISPHD
ncbi:MAG: TetR/AcrR family transcriptional regulator [Bacteroidales bacterium]|nr:TetR/AcrR family transcriptional regulator [Bacteroidales bacterium]